MKVCLLRVGVDTGSESGGMHGPLYSDGTFELIWVPQNFGNGNYGQPSPAHTYGMLAGKNHPERRLVEHFPTHCQASMSNQPVHVDPEFDTYTYGDPHRPRLRELEKDDILAFFCGLKGWGGCAAQPALYLIGFFQVDVTGVRTNFTAQHLGLFANNFHIRHQDRRNPLYLVKGTDKSCLFRKAIRLATLRGKCHLRYEICSVTCLG